MTSHSIISNGGVHVDDREENDFYATEPAAADLLLKAEYLNSLIWEPACGNGHLARRFSELGFSVIATDIVKRDYPCIKKDFLKTSNDPYCDIVTNPPYKLAADFIKKGFELLHPKSKLCLFLKLTFLESVARDKLFEQYPVSRIHVCRKRIKCAKNGDFSKVLSSPTCYAWFVWEKGYTGPTIIDRV